MTARLIPSLILGIAGVAVLMSLGFWQLRGWIEKLAQIAAIEARIGDAPGPLPAEPDPEADRFRPVTVEGATPARSCMCCRRAKGSDPAAG
jgi:surfeit locus 1 family protein